MAKEIDYVELLKLAHEKLGSQSDMIELLKSKLAGSKYTVDLFCVKYKELEKELEEAVTFNVDVVRCLSRIASVENHNEVPAYIDMSRRCIKTIEAKQAKALMEQGK
jgi:hypothetical protein